MKDKIFSLIEAGLTELNQELQYEELKQITPETVVFGGGDGIDSLSLAFLVSQLEIAVDEEFEKQVILADEKAMSMHSSPYRSVASLTDFIMTRLEENHG